jgi:uncharacterized surface protein with fasciclin (FAS1) repeats
MTLLMDSTPLVEDRPVDRIEAEPAETFNVFASLLVSVGLEQTLAGEGEFTVFAPTDKAFGDLSTDAMIGLLGDPGELRRVLCNHIALGRLTTAQLEDVRSAVTLKGRCLFLLKCAEDEIWIDDARMVETDLRARNGVVHAIDKVLCRR